jgi:hypothetical protein
MTGIWSLSKSIHGSDSCKEFAPRKPARSEPET